MAKKGLSAKARAGWFAKYYEGTDAAGKVVRFLVRLYQSDAAFESGSTGDWSWRCSRGKTPHAEGYGSRQEALAAVDKFIAKDLGLKCNPIVPPY